FDVCSRSCAAGPPGFIGRPCRSRPGKEFHADTAGSHGDPAGIGTNGGRRRIIKGAARCVAAPWSASRYLMSLTPLALVPSAPTVEDDPLELMDEIERLKREKDAVLLAHFYVDGEIQDIADFSGDSLKLARDAVQVTKSTIVFAGVHFMAESAKILNPSKKVLIPDLLAGCSLAESCPAEKLAAWQRELRSAGRDFETVAYINTTAAVKALCDWIVTSGNAREIIERVPADKEILFVPDQHLGRYLMEVTGRKMILWPGACMVHEIFSVQDLLRAKRHNPGAIVLAHPECPKSILDVSDVIGGAEASA